MMTKEVFESQDTDLKGRWIKYYVANIEPNFIWYDNEQLLDFYRWVYHQHQLKKIMDDLDITR